MSHWPKNRLLPAFLKCRRPCISHITWVSFRTLAPFYEKLFLVTSSLGIGTCRLPTLLVSYFETGDLFVNFCIRISGHCLFKISCSINAQSSLINSFTLNIVDGILSLIGADWIRVIAPSCNFCKLRVLIAERCPHSRLPYLRWLSTNARYT